MNLYFCPSYSAVKRRSQNVTHKWNGPPWIVGTSGPFGDWWLSLRFSSHLITVSSDTGIIVTSYNILYRPPTSNKDHPAINYEWSTGRQRMFDFWRHHYFYLIQRYSHDEGKCTWIKQTVCCVTGSEKLTWNIGVTYQWVSARRWISARKT